MNEKTHYLYSITRNDGKIYIGVSIDPEKRLYQHIDGLGSIHLKGHSYITFELLAEGNREEIYNAEKDYIIRLKPELNRAEGGMGGFSGNPAKGMTHGNSKLTDIDVVLIRELVYSGAATMADLANQYSVVYSCIYAICTGKRWTHVGGPLIEKKNKEYLIERVKYLRSQNIGPTQIARQLGIDRKSVYNYLK